MTPTEILNETIRKASLGIPLTDPTPEKLAIYNQYIQAQVNKPKTGQQAQNSDPLTPSLLQPAMIDKYISIGVGFMFLSFIIGIFRR